MPRSLPHFRGFYGQQAAIRPVLHLLGGAIARGEPLGHLKISGPSGSGKTHLAQARAEETGTRLLTLMGRDTEVKLAEQLLQVRKCDYLLIDEAHSLEPRQQELLFEAIDSQSIPAAERPHEREKSTEAAPRRQLQPFTLVLATDRPGLLLNALHKRIPIAIHFQPYSESELKEIVAAIATQCNMLLTPQAARVLAAACGSLPRMAKLHLLNLR